MKTVDGYDIAALSYMIARGAQNHRHLLLFICFFFIRSSVSFPLFLFFYFFSSISLGFPDNRTFGAFYNFDFSCLPDRQACLPDRQGFFPSVGRRACPPNKPFGRRASRLSAGGVSNGVL
jgi:hypothetical protein